MLLRKLILIVREIFKDEETFRQQGFLEVDNYIFRNWLIMCFVSICVLDGHLKRES